MWAWTGWSLSFHCFDKTVVKVSALILRWKHQVLSLWGICHSSSRLWFSSTGDLVRIRRFHTCNCVCSCGISCCTWLLDVRFKPNSGSRKSHKVCRSKSHTFYFCRELQRQCLISKWAKQNLSLLIFVTVKHRQSGGKCHFYWCTVLLTSGGWFTPTLCRLLRGLLYWCTTFQSITHWSDFQSIFQMTICIDKV